VPALAGKRLLIVEGDAQLAALLAAEAERLGARVSLCGSGDEAVAVLEVWPADGAFLDLPLAEGDPRELIAALERNAIPAVAASASGSPEAEAARRLGARRVLPRPVRIGEILEALGRAVEEGPVGGAEGAAGVDDFDSIVFSQGRPALEEVVPGPLRRADPVGLARPLPEVERRRTPGAAAEPLLPSGDLARAPLPRLLSVLHAGQATAALLLQRRTERKLVLLDGGAVVFAASNAPRERFGPRCVREGILGAPALVAILKALAPGETTAAALQARGLLDPERRARLVASQVAEIVSSAVAWREGSYRIALGPLQPRERVPLALFPGDRILEGMRAIASPAALREDVPAEGALGRAPWPAVDPLRLSLRPGEAELLALADGTKGVGDLLSLSPLGEREALAFLAACRHMGILAEVDRGLSSTRRIGFM
jgi:CheY-like chemotaxis protein